MPVKYEIDSSIPVSWENPIYTAGDTWSAPSPNFAYFKTNSAPSNVQKGAVDGEGGKIAQYTRAVYGDDFNGNTIDSFQITFDEDEEWSPSGSSSGFDVEAVAAHELGHSLGLDHSNFQRATMENSFTQGNTDKRSLEQDDKNGLKAIY